MKQRMGYMKSLLTAKLNYNALTSSKDFSEKNEDNFNC